MLSYKEKIVQFLSRNDIITDTQKDVAGKGILQRYMEMYGEYIDEEIKPFVDNLIDNTRVPKTIASNLITNAEQVYGLDVYNDLSDDGRRRMLGIIFNLRKIKGTKRAFTVLFGMLRMTCVLTVYPAVYGFDSPLTLDDPERTFDQKCKACVNYGLQIDSYGGHPPFVSERTCNAISSIVNYNTPVDAVLKTVVCNTFNLAIENPSALNGGKYIITYAG